MDHDLAAVEPAVWDTGIVAWDTGIITDLTLGLHDEELALELRNLGWGYWADRAWTRVTRLPENLALWISRGASAWSRRHSGRH